nr:PD-(D/E)XK motif protein [uncultured Nocardioides sp.]
MTGSVSEQFALLLGDNRPTEARVLTRPTGASTALGPVLLGIDDEGLRHLLVPIPDGEQPKDRVSRGIDLGHRDLFLHGVQVRFADLSCTIGRLTGPFDKLVEDIVGRLERDPAAGLNAVIAALDDWRALLRQAINGLSREEIVGLIGELEVMAKLAATNPSEAVLGWTGPSGAVHDFSRNGYDIEVKSTAAVNANAVRISNLDQLDPTLSTDLHLAVVHLAASTDAPDIETRIEELLAMGVPADALETRLGHAGYYRGMELSVPSKYALRGIRWWNVDGDFPGLRASDIDISRLVGIDGISYDLLLGVLPTALSPDAAAQLAHDWAT